MKLTNFVILVLVLWGELGYASHVQSIPDNTALIMPKGLIKLARKTYLIISRNLLEDLEVIQSITDIFLRGLSFSPHEPLLKEPIKNFMRLLKQAQDVFLIDWQTSRMDQEQFPWMLRLTEHITRLTASLYPQTQEASALPELNPSQLTLGLLHHEKMDNQEIEEALFTSQQTATTHLNLEETLLDKLDNLTGQFTNQTTFDEFQPVTYQDMMESVVQDVYSWVHTIVSLSKGRQPTAHNAQEDIKETLAHLQLSLPAHLKLVKI